MILAGLASSVATAGPDRDRATHGVLSDSGFFPIGVWLQSPANAPKYKAIGVNTFVGLWRGPTEAQLADLRKYGMRAIVEQNDIGLNSPNSGIIKGWMQPDEPDNAQPLIPALGIYGPCIPAAEVAARSRAIKARDPTRPVLVNFGQGVADPSWHGRGACTGDMAYYDTAVAGADILSFDIYPVASARATVKGKLDYVARGVANLVRRARPGQTVWTAIETTALDPKRPITPTEVRAEVWMALTHGAKGIVYFVHEWKPRFREDGIFRHPDIVDEVTRIDQRIASLAAVLNSPDIADAVTVSSSAPIRVMAKRRDDLLYLFAVAMENRPSAARFGLRGLPAEAVVLDEARRIPIENGVFEDDFAGYAVHLYAISFVAGHPGK